MACIAGKRCSIPRSAVVTNVYIVPFFAFLHLRSILVTGDILPYLEIGVP